jgi:hypothetical protein
MLALSQHNCIPRAWVGAAGDRAGGRQRIEGSQGRKPASAGGTLVLVKAKCEPGTGASCL